MARYWKEKTNPGPVEIRPKKTKEPAPGSYNIEDSLRKTQWRSRIFKIPNTKNNSYIGNLFI